MNSREGRRFTSSPAKEICTHALGLRLALELERSVNENLCEILDRVAIKRQKEQARKYMLPIERGTPRNNGRASYQKRIVATNNNPVISITATANVKSKSVLTFLNAAYHRKKHSIAAGASN